MTDRLLPGSLRSAADLLQKVRRDAALLDEEVTSDRFFNFVVTAYSLVDWIDHDPTVPITAKAPAEIAALRADQWLLLCGDAARSEEHTSELQSHSDLVCRLLLEKKKHKIE